MVTGCILHAWLLSSVSPRPNWIFSTPKKCTYQCTFESQRPKVQLNAQKKIMFFFFFSTFFSFFLKWSSHWLVNACCVLDCFLAFLPRPSCIFLRAHGAFFLISSWHSVQVYNSLGIFLGRTEGKFPSCLQHRRHEKSARYFNRARAQKYPASAVTSARQKLTFVWGYYTIWRVFHGSSVNQALPSCILEHAFLG